MPSHEDLCRRAVSWLRSHHRCDPVFTRGASCAEIPDAIGWSSQLSFVVECKTSRSDLFAERWKYIGYRDPRFGFIQTGGVKNAKYRLSYESRGYQRVPLPSMGLRRYFLCDGDLIGEDDLTGFASDHGLLHLAGRSIRIIREAPERPNESIDLKSETRYLRMRLLHLRSNMLGIGYSMDFDRATLLSGRSAITMPHENVAECLKRIEADAEV